MRTQLIRLTYLLFFFCSTLVNAQEQIGLGVENYSGVNSLALNPANGPSSKFAWDVNLLGAGIFGETNYAFIYNTNVSEIIRLLPEGDLASNYPSENQFPENMLIVDFYDNNRRKYVNLNATVLGPSVMINLENGHSFGVFTKFRSAASVQRAPSELNYYFFDRTSFGEEIRIDPLIGAAMSWSEVGLNYSRRIIMSSGNLDIGGSLKFLNGYEAVFLNSNKTFGLTQLSNDSISINAPDLEYGLTLSNADGEGFNLSRNGGGIAFDLGAVFTIDGYDDSYKWKFGAALLDIGRINFNRNAQQHRVDTDAVFELSSDDYRRLDEVDEVLELFSTQSLGDSLLSLQQNNFSIWLPGALSLQADYMIMDNFYVNATLIQRLPYRQNAVRRGNLMAIAPRFEHRWFGAMIPVSFFNYNRFRVGASFRLAFLTIGTENLTSFIGRSNFTGSDIYFAIKVNPFEIGFGSGGGWGGRKGKRVKCYEF